MRIHRRLLRRPHHRPLPVGRVRRPTRRQSTAGYARALVPRGTDSLQRGEHAADWLAAAARGLFGSLVEPCRIGLGAAREAVGRAALRGVGDVRRGGRPTWYSLQPGAWRRDSTNTLRYSGTVYRTTG